MYSVRGNRKYQIENKNGQWLINGKQFNGSINPEDSTGFIISEGNSIYKAEIESISDDQTEFSVSINHIPFTLKVKDRLDLLAAEMGMKNIGKKKSEDVKAPMPGLILEVNVEAGEKVKKGDKLLILEAMKMENIIKAGHDGTIKEITIEKGQNVDKNQVLIRY